MYNVVYTKTAKKDLEKLKYSSLSNKAEFLIKIIKNNPYHTPPIYEKLSGDMAMCYSRRINIQHRLVYQVFEEENAIKILSMWSHYENAKKIFEEEHEHNT